MIHSILFRTLTALAALLSTGSALAHPGHAEHAQVTFAQMLSEPQGALWIMALAVTLVGIVINWRQGWRSACSEQRT